MNFQTLQEINQANFPSILIFGNAGTGKTTSITSAPLEIQKQTVIFAAEMGLLSIADNKHLRAVEIENWSKFRNMLSHVRSVEDVKYIFLDSATELSSKLSSELYDKSGKSKLTFDEYNEILMKSRKAFKYIVNNMKIGFICTALAKEEKDERLKTFVVRPRLTGSIREEFPAYFDFVFYSQVIQGQYYWFTQSSPVMLCKDRTGILPNPMPQNLSMVFDAYDLRVKDGLSPEEAKEIFNEKYKIKNQNQNKTQSETAGAA